MISLSTLITPTSEERAPLETGHSKLISAEPCGWRQHWTAITRYRDFFLLLRRTEFQIRFRNRNVALLSILGQPLISACVAYPALPALSKSLKTPFLSIWLGFLVWQFLTRSISMGGASLKSKRHVIGKIDFPRILLPLSVLVNAGLEFLIGFIPLSIIATYWGVQRGGLEGLALPAVLLSLSVLLIFGLAIALLLCTLDFIYRDISNLTPFLLQVILIVSPILYPPEVFSGFYRLFLFLNPITLVLSLLRWQMMGGPAVLPVQAALAMCSWTAFTGLGVWVFFKNEPFLGELGE